VEYALALIVLLALVAIVVVRPLVRDSGEPEPDPGRRAELEAAKEAKYREIRDAELDHATVKLDKEDWRAIDRQLRAEAVQILREIDRLGADAPPSDR
jgi:membrane protein implicated in regulation of membrane protease activity